MQITYKGNAVNHSREVHRAATRGNNTLHVYNSNVIIVQVINHDPRSTYYIKMVCLKLYLIKLLHCQ